MSSATGCEIKFTGSKNFCRDKKGHNVLIFDRLGGKFKYEAFDTTSEENVSQTMFLNLRSK